MKQATVTTTTTLTLSQVPISRRAAEAQTRATVALNVFFCLFPPTLMAQMWSKNMLELGGQI